MELEGGPCFTLGLHTMVFQVEKYVIIMENIEKGYKDRNIHILSDNQAAIMALHIYRQTPN
jgi:hypothetical protein